ncbi:hypothetical protein GCM10010123_33320 [Pilimelia anulata]|uniref:Uncharacterized protein n=1 Tax=Pilimelia anulata TaxID=53371 RepID=A0A8J3BCJ0_9ACTN|nr:efflux RND transporter periplasmic adaptor subunit [Pilimelia anulata]GGK00752.1 hypothetical protein GCM10010123_33320 [Pilimelia anulata]
MLGLLVLSQVAAAGTAYAITRDAAPGDPAAAATVDRGPVTVQLSATGTVESTRTRSLAFTADGTVTAVRVRVGDPVRVGQVLAAIDSSALAERVGLARTGLDLAETALTEARAAATTAANAAAGTTTTDTAAAGTTTDTAAAAGTAVPAAAAGATATAAGTATAATNGASGGGVALRLVAEYEPLYHPDDDPDAGEPPGRHPRPRHPRPPHPCPCPSPSPSPTPTASPSPTKPHPSTPGGGTGNPGGSGGPGSPGNPGGGTGTGGGRNGTGNGNGNGGGGGQNGGPGGNGTGGGQNGSGRNGQNGSGRAGSAPGGRNGDGRSGAGQDGSGQGGDAILSTEQRVNRARRQLADLEAQLAGTTITAPIAGKVLALAGKVGTAARAGGTFIEVSDVNRLQVATSFPEADAGRLATGQAASVTIPGIADPVPATVTAVDPVGTTTNAVVTYGAVLGFARAPAGLLLGQSARVLVTAGAVRDAVRVPTGAVHDIAAGRGTVRVVADGRASDRPIGVGVQGDQYIEVTSGLAEGERVRTAW